MKTPVYKLNQTKTPYLQYRGQKSLGHLCNGTNYLCQFTSGLLSMMVVVEPMGLKPEFYNIPDCKVSGVNLGGC